MFAKISTISTADFYMVKLLLKRLGAACSCCCNFEEWPMFLLLKKFSALEGILDLNLPSLQLVVCHVAAVTHQSTHYL